MNQQKLQYNMQNTLVGTPLYLSPILWDAFIKKQNMNVVHDLQKSDVFSLGLTFLEMATLANQNEIVGCNQQKGD